MDRAITKGLELGVAFTMFLVGLGVFFAMGQHMTNYIQQAANRSGLKVNYSQVEAVDVAYHTSRDEIYFRLLESEIEMVSVDGVDLLTLYKRRIDSPGVPVHELIEAIEAEVSAIGDVAYSELLVVNSIGELISIEYTHR